VFALPFLLQQSVDTAGFGRSDQTILYGSAAPIDYFMLQPDARGASLPWITRFGGSGHFLYPGTALLMLAIAGFVLGLRRSAPDAPGADVARVVGFCLIAGTLALVLSLGLRLDLGGFRPYEVLRQHVPGYESIRNPFRFAALVQILLLPPAAVALDRLWRW